MAVSAVIRLRRKAAPRHVDRRHRRTAGETPVTTVSRTHGFHNGGRPVYNPRFVECLITHGCCNFTFGPAVRLARFQSDGATGRVLDHSRLSEVSDDLSQG